MRALFSWTGLKQGLTCPGHRFRNSPAFCPHTQSVQIGRLSMVKLEAEAGTDEWHIADFRQKGSRTKRGTQVVF